MDHGTEHFNRGLIPPGPLPVSAISGIDFEQLQRDIEEGRAYVHGHASALLPGIQRQVTAFFESLDPRHEVGAMLSQFGIDITLRVERILAIDPHIIALEGIDEYSKEPRQVLQHVSQFNLLLIPLEVGQDQKKRPVGFQRE